jgi:Flp pilus assembly pilin Flp
MGLGVSLRRGLISALVRKRGVNLWRTRVPSQALDSEAGITAIEYSLLGVLVALGLILGATFLGSELGKAYDFIGTTLDELF